MALDSITLRLLKCSQETKTPHPQVAGCPKYLSGQGENLTYWDMNCGPGLLRTPRRRKLTAPKATTGPLPVFLGLCEAIRARGISETLHKLGKFGGKGSQQSHRRLWTARLPIPTASHLRSEGPDPNPPAGSPKARRAEARSRRSR